MKTRFDGHTEGPWHVAEHIGWKTDGECMQHEVAVVYGGYCISPLHIHSGVKSDPEKNGDPDARLMAAAPSLLAELVACREAFQKIIDENTDPRLLELCLWKTASIDKLIGVEETK